MTEKINNTETIETTETKPKKTRKKAAPKKPATPKTCGFCKYGGDRLGGTMFGDRFVICDKRLKIIDKAKTCEQWEARE